MFGLTGNAVFWQAVGIVVLGLVGWAVRHLVAYLKAHGEWAKVQTEYQRLLGAYSAWGRVIKPLLAAEAPSLERVLTTYLEALTRETGLPAAQLEQVGIEVWHTLTGSLVPADPAPTPPEAPSTPVAAPVDPSPSPLPAEAGTPPVNAG